MIEQGQRVFVRMSGICTALMSRGGCCSLLRSLRFTSSLLPSAIGEEIAMIRAPDVLGQLKKHQWGIVSCKCLFQLPEMPRFECGPHQSIGKSSDFDNFRRTQY